MINNLKKSIQFFTLLNLLSIQSFQLSAQTYSLGSNAGSTTFDNTVNSDGASLSTCNCPTGSVVVGIKGNQGSMVDKLTIKCAPLNSDGSLGSVTTMTTYVGTSTGGTSFDYTFSGKAMVGYEIRTGDFLDGITLKGQSISYIAAGSTNSSGATNLTSAGGSGGSGATYWAPNGNVIIGMNFRNGTIGGGLSFNYAPISS